MRVVSLWWQILINPESRLLDQRFSDLAASTIAANEAWTRREPERGEAWFYLAGAYAPRVQWRVLRSERLAAAREGKKIKDALERARQLEPTLNDAARYPYNPLFRQRIAEVRDTCLRDHEASAQAWRRLLDRAREGRVYDARTAEVRARLGLASQLSALNRVDETIEHLKIVVGMRPTSPVGAHARAERQLRAAVARNSKR